MVHNELATTTMIQRPANRHQLQIDVVVCASRSLEYRQMADGLVSDIRSITVTVKRNIKLTGEIVTVDKKDLLPPVADVPIVVQTGLNYNDHVKEATEVGYQVRCFLVPLQLKDLLLLIDVCACRTFHLPAHISSGGRQPVSLVHTRK